MINNTVVEMKDYKENSVQQEITKVICEQNDVRV